MASPTGHGPQPGASADCAIPKLWLPRTTAGTSKMLWDAKCARNFVADFSLDVHFWSEHPKKSTELQGYLIYLVESLAISSQVPLRLATVPQDSFPVAPVAGPPAPRLCRWPRPANTAVEWNLCHSQLRFLSKWDPLQENQIWLGNPLM